VTTIGALEGSSGQFPDSGDGGIVRWRRPDSYGRARYFSHPHCGVQDHSISPKDVDNKLITIGETDRLNQRKGGTVAICWLTKLA